MNHHLKIYSISHSNNYIPYILNHNYLYSSTNSPSHLLFLYSQIYSHLIIVSCFIIIPIYVYYIFN